MEKTVDLGEIEGIKITKNGGNTKISLDTDATPTQNSTKPVESGGVYTALSNKADNTDIPTKTSELSNDSGYITASANVASANYATSAGSASEAAHATSADSATNATNANYANTAGNVPTKLSQLENDLGLPSFSNAVFATIYQLGSNVFTEETKIAANGFKAFGLLTNDTWEWSWNNVQGKYIVGSFIRNSDRSRNDARDFHVDCIPNNSNRTKIDVRVRNLSSEEKTLYNGYPRYDLVVLWCNGTLA